MTQNKNSYRNKDKDFAEISNKRGHASEFGAIIKNDPKNYPNIKSWKNQVPIISDKCIGHGVCESVCPEGAISIREINGKKRAVVDYNLCKGEGMCATVCPTGAITMRKFKK